MRTENLTQGQPVKPVCSSLPHLSRFNDIEKILDCEEKDVDETVDDAAPEVVEAGAAAPHSTDTESTAARFQFDLPEFLLSSPPQSNDDSEAGTVVRSQVWNGAERCRQILAMLWDPDHSTRQNMKTHRILGRGQ
jgi:hypothetical protein